ncbi:MAG: LysR family transcriptional regulator [Imperialibacter sp.]|uniref:LysR family transcriptional regulator n=1 Tax=Imperialibacter sp. TaxID=2038411 RepID=UPI0032EAE5C9
MPISNQIELRHFKYFLEVAEELHFRKAAEKLFITQPGLSRQIQQLEEELDVKLFVRNKRNVALTAPGKYLQQELKGVINNLDFIVKQLKMIEAGDDGEVRIGFVGSAMQRVIPKVLLEINKQYPSIHTTLTEMANQEQLEGLMHDKLDIGFVRLEHAQQEMQLVTVFEDTFSLVLPQDHPMNEDNFVDLHQLKEENFILFSSDYSVDYFNQFMNIFEASGFRPKVSHRSVHASTIFRLVENNLGIAIVPTTLKEGFSLKVKFIELKNGKQTARLSAMWKRENENPALRKFLEVMLGEHR